MARRRGDQLGMSGSGWFMVIIMLFGAISLGLKVIPFYMEHNGVDGQILSLLENPELERMTRQQMFRKLDSMLRLNNIRDFPMEDRLEVEKSGGNVKMHLFYEVRQPLFWNVDVILTFEEEYEKVL